MCSILVQSYHGSHLVIQADLHERYVFANICHDQPQGHNINSLHCHFNF